MRSARLSAALGRLPAAGFSLYAGAAAFLTYFCMYGLRRPFAVASYEGLSFAGMGLKEVLVISQVLGYTLSKFLGVRFGSELDPRRRTRALVTLVLVAEAALLLFGLLPGPWKIAAIFLNGLPLGAIWGLVFAYLEGRRTSDFLGAALSSSYIVSSGEAKRVGQLWLGAGVPETWMPAVTGLTFLVPLLVGAWLLHQIPPPSPADEAERSARPPVRRAERRAFLRDHAAGLVPLLVLYFFLTALRDYRDSFAKEIWTELGLGQDASVYAAPEWLIGALVMVAMACVVFTRDNARAVRVVYGMMTGGMLLVGLATAAYDLDWIGGPTWMTAVGLGLYLAYVPYGCILFDRLIALLRSAATAVFVVYLADGIGYLGVITVILFQQSGGGGTGSRFEFFHGLCYVASAVCALGFLLSARAFLGQAPRDQG